MKRVDNICRDKRKVINMNEEMYVDFDTNTNLWLILGTESGHAYGSFMDEESALATMGEK